MGDASGTSARHVGGKHREQDQDDGDDPGGRKTRAHESVLLDPSARQAASLAPPVTAGPLTSAEATEAPRARMSMEELLPHLVKRIAWAGDRQRGTVRLELGAGAYEGATVTVHADGGRVRVEIGGAGTEELRARVDERLRRHGLDVESVT